MGRLLKFDLYKSVKSASTWIVLLCVIVFSIVSLSLTYVSKTEGELPDVALEIGELTTTVPLEDMTVVDWCIDSVSGDFLMLFVIVFAILFSCTDYTTGFIKNVYNSLKHKWIYVLSKLIVVSAFTILTIVLTYIVTVSFNLAIVQSSTFGDIAELLKFTFYKGLLLVAYGCVGVLVSFILRKATAGLVFCMGYSFMFANLVYSGINQIVKSAKIAENFDIQKYTLVGNAISVSPDVSSEQEGIILIVCLSAIAISFIISSLLFSRRDI